MPKPETVLVAAIRRALTEAWPDAMVLKIHGSPYQPAGLPDLLVLRAGVASWIEVKMPGNKPTMLQHAMHARLREHGCDVLVASSTEEVTEWVLTRAR